LASEKRARPRNASGEEPAGTSAMAVVARTHWAVKKARNGSRRPPRSLTAPRTGETTALMPTLTALATPNQNCPSPGPRRSTAHRPIAYDTMAYE